MLQNWANVVRENWKLAQSHLIQKKNQNKLKCTLHREQNLVS